MAEVPNTPSESCDYCPILHRCVKYRMAPADLLKLEAILEKWDTNKTGVALLVKFGRLVQKLRGPGNG